MIMSQFILQTILVLSTLFIGSINFFIAFIKEEKIRNILLITVSIFFLLNTLIIDLVFIGGIRVNIPIFTIGHYSLALYLEPIGLIFFNLLAFLWICALLYTIGYLRANNIQNAHRFLFFINLSVMSGMIVSLSDNIITMFVAYEILTLATIPLISHGGGIKGMQGLRSYLYVLMLTSIMLFLPAILIIDAKVGHTNFTYGGFIAEHISKHYSILLLMMFCFGISKATLYPVHSWLPSAMVASYPVSALLHAVVVVKTGLFCIYKIIVYVFGLSYLNIIFGNFNWIILLPVIGILYSSYKALVETNIKMILAYSTINQLNIALLSAFMFTKKSIFAAVLHMLSHSFTKICLFYGFGSLYTITRSSQIYDLVNISQKEPKITLLLFISSLSLIGVPPFAGFISKFYIMLAAAEADYLLVAVIIALSSVFSAVYLSRIIMFMYRPYVHAKLKKSLQQGSITKGMYVSLGMCFIFVIFYYIVLIFVQQFL